MKCREYKDLVAAHVDGHLSDREELEADQHAGLCASCEAERLAQTEAKAAVRNHHTIAPAPASLRHSIEARVKRRSPVRTRILVTGAIAATVLLSTVPLLRRGEPGVIPMLAADVARVEASGVDHPTDDAGDLRAYYAHHGLAFQNSVDDLRPYGFNLVGGSTSRLGAIPTTQTLYEAGSDRLVCRRFRADGFQWPAGGQRMGQSEVFSHDGVYVSLTRLGGDVVCAMISRMPPDRFVTALHGDH